MRGDLPSGTVTFLFTDVEGSTRLLHELGDTAYAEALAEHRRLIREACAAEGGVEVDTQGDAFFFAFPTAPGAVAAAEELTRVLAPGPIQVRVGMHTGTPLVTEDGYVGADVHRAARIAAAGHGAQVILASSTGELVDRELTDLGSHRLKDLSAPVRLYQLGDGSFPPLRTLYQTNLPIPATSFVGRERELEDVALLMSRDDIRLLTLTGPGGTGKSRLGAQAAARVADEFPDGVWWIPLAALHDPELVLETAGQVLGARTALAEHIADSSLLLVFDNFEHLVDAAPGVADLLASCPNLRLLVTSREPLHVTGEQEYAVPPFVHEEGVGFFLARARAVRHDFQPDAAVHEICRRLDDLPLALELAAARVKSLSSRQILDRLDQRLSMLTGGAREVPEHQRTLRATIEWSYELLTTAERRLHVQLAVFRGGCTLDAADAVCGTDLDTLQSLVDKSLLGHMGERYRMLESIREFAAEQLERSGEEAAVCERHAGYFLERAEATGGTHVFEGDQSAAFERLEVELDNFRAAIEWSLERKNYERVHRFGGALWFFWSVRGYFAEGRRLLEPAVTSSDPSSESWVWGAMALGELDRDHGDFERARSLKEQVLPILRDRGEIRAVAGTLADLGDLAMDRGEYAHAHELLEESLALRDHPDAVRGLSRTLGSLSQLAVHEGDLERAERLAERAVEKAMESDSTAAHTGWALGRLGDVRQRRGDLPGAEHAYRDALRIMHALRNALGVANGLDGLAVISLARGEAERAGRLVGAAAALRLDARLGSARTESLPPEVPDRARAEGAALGFDEAVEYALASID